MEKGGECLQLLFLIEIDVQLFILQPFIGVDADIAISVGVDDEGVGGVFVSVGFEDFLSTVIGWVTTAGEVRNGWYDHDGLGVLVPSHNQIADLSFASVDKAVIESFDVLGIAYNQTVLLAILHHLIKQGAHLFLIGCALFHIRLWSFK